MDIESKQLSIEEIRKIELGILDDVDAFCSEHDIRYFLACGTLLGAIRHKGFIPWDDDIDIMMPRPDYERFIETYFNDGNYVLNPSEGFFYYAKVCDRNTIKIEEGMDYNNREPFGVDIDVFPLDGIINDEKEIRKICRKSFFLETLLNLSNQPIFYRKNPIKAINRIIPRMIGRGNLVKLIEKNAKKYDYDKNDYVIRIRKSSNGFTGALSKDIYNVVNKEFEGKLYPVPSGFDIWLTKFYGNYTIIPEKEKQKKHSNKCYAKGSN